jgi:hypothetical protein
MTRGILIVANESPVAAAVAAAARARVQTIAVALVPDRLGPAVKASHPSEGGPAPKASGPAKGADGAIPWNPASPVSARSLVVGAENRLGRIDEALLVCSPPPMRRRADELVPAQIDALVDDLVKGWFLAARELSLAFRARNAGTLALVLSEAGLGGSKDDVPDLFGSVVAASFRAFAQGLLSSSFRESYRVLAFSSAEAGDDAGFAEFVFKTLDEGAKRDSGKWHKYGKGGLFGLM